MDKTIYKLKLETINEESIIFIPSAGKCGVIYTLHKDLIANCFKNTSSTAFAIQEIKKCFEEEWVNRWYFILYDIDFDDLIVKYYNLYIKPDLKEKINCKKEQGVRDTDIINNLYAKIKQLEKDLEGSKYIIKEYSKMLDDSHKNNDRLIDKLNETTAINNLYKNFTKLTSKKQDDYMPYKELYTELLAKSKNDEITIDNLCNKVTELKDTVDDNMESLKLLESFNCLRHAPPTDNKEVTFIGIPKEPFFTGQRIAYFIATLAGFSIIDLLIRAYIG